ncbi:Uu.00g110880.m01.CDS01 [Anthostomella pinea]|uniref:Uu.00g110880.m01.CDS01 n=1 Tax=Anthostomella pinea TaxID=933095 RepID=A0AAI8VF06_9PEZI|nr:Uu.00g110880.m01.CDS01 [Anthostomella pinea]
MSFLNKLKNKAEELNRKHNIGLPLGQGSQQQTHPSSQQYYPGQQPPQGQWQQPPQGQWQQPSQGQWQQPQQGQWHQPTQPNTYNRPAVPPPIPSHSRPPPSDAASHTQQSGAPPAQPQASQVYWRANFHPDIPVGQEFEQKQGHGDPYGWGNNELENYTSHASNSLFTPDHKLIVRAVSQPQHPDPEARYTSARLVTRRTLGRARGCLTAWLTLPCAEGVWPAFWMLPREPFEWPHEGEVDIAEAWNAEFQNHSCLHWGAYNSPEDMQKHLVRQTHIPDMGHRAVRFDFVWDCGTSGVRADGKSNGGGRLMWIIDGRPVMKNLMPPGTRPIEDWCVLLNVAMGGTVCQGKAPRDGIYDMVVHALQMSEEPEGGWWKFENDWHGCPHGAVM